MDKQRGFSLVELMLVVGILMLIASAVTVMNSRWYLQNNLDGAKNMVLSSLRKAQTYSISKKNNLTWGVCMTGNVIRMFGGSCASPTIKDDYDLPTGIVVTGLTTVTFSNLRGEPSSAQAITITGNSGVMEISVNEMGGVNVN